ncbi:MAG: PEP-CTERM sorting domain-containing protein [Opitutales bacterium]|nr:PEP-CTERM sorting domain-containing protein [Opitutales bacterium]
MCPITFKIPSALACTLSVAFAFSTSHLSAAGTGDGSSEENAIDISQADIISTSTYWDSTNSRWVVAGNLYYANSGNLDFGTANSGCNLVVGLEAATNTILNISSGDEAEYTLRDYAGYIAFNSGSTAQVNVSGIGTEWVNANNLYVGRGGSGTLNIDSGASVSAASSYLGYDDIAYGETIVSGSGSQWINSGILYVGYNGYGTFVIQNGATVSNGRAYIGYGASSSGNQVYVGGAGSRWTCSNELTIGATGSGSMTVSDGAYVSSASARIGSLGTGVATVEGAGTLWEIGQSGVFYVGYSGNGNLIVNTGARVTSGSSVVGELAGSTGVVIIDGGRWDCAGSLTIGHSGTAQVELKEDSLVTATSISIGSDGVLRLNGGFLAITSLDMEADYDALFEYMTSGARVAAWDADSEAYVLLNSDNYDEYATLVSYENIEDCDALDGYGLTGSYTVLTAVPEPATYALFGGLGAFGLAMYRRRTARK